MEKAGIAAGKPPSRSPSGATDRRPALVLQLCPEQAICGTWQGTSLASPVAPSLPWPSSTHSRIANTVAISAYQPWYQHPRPLLHHSDRGIVELVALTIPPRPLLQRIAYVYKAQKAINGTKVRVIWGRVTRAHGEHLRAVWSASSSSMDLSRCSIPSRQLRRCPRKVPCQPSSSRFRCIRASRESFPALGLSTLGSISDDASISLCSQMLYPSRI